MDLKELLQKYDQDLQVVAQRIESLHRALEEAQIIQQRLIGGRDALRLVEAQCTTKTEQPKE